MAESLNTSPVLRRRACLAGLVLGGSLLVLAAAHVLAVALRSVALYSGFTLLFFCLVLTLFNGRKKLPFLPLGSARAWLDFHVCVGWISLVLFGCHLGWQWPHSVVNVVLASTFLLVALSGVVGLWLSRILPPRLVGSGEPLTYERIPRLRAEIGEEARLLALEAARATSASSTFGDFYTRCLHSYLHAAPPWFLALRTTDSHYRSVSADLQALRRYMNDQERLLAERFDAIITAKRNLDFQASAQRLLKLWLFVHIPFTYSLLLLVVAHVLTVLAYHGRW